MLIMTDMIFCEGAHFGLKFKPKRVSFYNFTFFTLVIGI